MASGDLYDIRNALALGNYTAVINDAPSIKAPYQSAAAATKSLLNGRDYLLAKAQIGLRRYTAAIAELESSQWRPHKALVLLAQYLKAPSDHTGDATREGILATATQLVDEALTSEKEATADDALMATACATIAIHAADFKTAHKWLKTWAVALQKKAEGAASNETLLSELNVLRLDVHALVVDILLRINRSDLAEQELKVMNKIDDDAPVSLLWTGYVKLGSDALKLFSQLADMHGTTQLLLNAVGLAQMSTGAYEQALDTFEEALAIRDSDPDTIINHLTALKQVKPHADIRSQIEQLVANHPSHPWVWKYKSLEENFTEAANLVKNR
eukprot:Rhum_TRINITY_DN18755_c0_g1::Rhum_TRINITY_DN18755_c0_g1_i1::g.168342::m.168342/K17268/COPE; coatomer subunit epsilon